VRNAAVGLLVVGATLLLAACYLVSSYRGDGSLASTGILTRPYVLDLGPIDISKAGTYSYKLSNLPHVRFTIGVEIIELQPNRYDRRPDHGAHVRLHLTAANGETVVLEDGSLQNWIWSHGEGDTKSFLYRWGESREVRLPTGNIKWENFDVRASSGWGSTFIAEESKSYALTFEVKTPNRTTRPARLLFYGEHT
jgi:hypothetical protein